MAWTTKQGILAVLLIFTGSINTISTKWADYLKAYGSDQKEKREFNHPFVQASCMFLGEFLCLICFKIVFFYYSRKQDGSVEENSLTRGNQSFNPFIFLPPALCDMIATSLMYIGLNMTYPSSFQMLRGSVIVFVALLSVAFLHRSISMKMWGGIFLVLSGLIVVGASDFLVKNDNKDTKSLLTGDMIIVAAQIIVATQMVYEEKFVNSRDIPPLQAVGWEGFFGFVILGLLLIPFYYIKVPFANNAHGVLEDLPDALAQMADNKLIIVSMVGTLISIAFFNFAGISVTKEMSATTRMVLDSVRILFIYLFSYSVHWQMFHPLQVVGFILLLLGMATYNNLFPKLSTIRQALRRESPDALVPNENN